jgi:hypothetical protein
MLDVFFISMGEEGSEANWQRLLSFAPHAKRVDNITGIYNVHKACAQLSTTKNFYVVDADAWVLDGFKFHWEPDANAMHWDIPETECVLVWPSRNPVNGLEYGYGGIKMFPHEPFLENKPWDIDLSTTIGRATISKEQVGCETRFNATPEGTWIGAFRECAKLASLSMIKSRVRTAVRNRNAELAELAERVSLQTDKTAENRATYRRVQSMFIVERYSNESNIYSYWAEIEECSRRRLHWTTVGWEAHNGQCSILGAQAGSNFGLQYSDDLSMLDKINNWDWLKEEFKNVNV